MCVHKNEIQRRHFLEMSPEEKRSAVRNYMDLLDRFIEKEDPDLEILKNEVMADLNGIIRDDPSLRAVVKSLTT